ncbi:MAG: class I SAM-dependent methyltransferase [Spirochaetota bacterium]|nr:class I SAM-dependent methyltransferase [Spirochaetota bacterium]
MLVKFFKRIFQTFVGTNNQSTRDHWLEIALLNIPTGLRILDAGAGELQYKKFCSHLNYVSQDFAQYDGKGDYRGLQTKTWNQTKLDIISDITNIPEPDESFDVIMCIEVFEHIPNPVLAIKEFSRLIKKGGQLIITAPFCSLTHFAPYHFYTGFNRYFYETHLPAFGFEIVDLEANGNFFEYIAQEVRRIPSIAERYTNDKPGKLEKLAINKVLRMLNRFSKKDQNSSEFLNYGLHVRAVKK